MKHRKELTEAFSEARRFRAAARAAINARVCKLALEGRTPTEIRRRIHISDSAIRAALAAAGIVPTLRPGPQQLEYAP